MAGNFYPMLRRYFVVWLLFAALIAASCYYLWLHRRPFTQNAFVTANVRVVTALVPGYIEEIHIRNNEYVKKGQKLMTIFRGPYRFKMESAVHAYAAAQSAAKKTAAQIEVASATIDKIAAELANAQYLSNQAAEMYKVLAVSQAYAEERLRSSQALAAQLTAAKHNLAALQHEYTQSLAAVKQLGAEADLAKLYHEWTVIYAQSDGYVNNMYISPGAYVQAGSPLFAVVDDGEWFIQANFKETELSQLRVGQKALIWLWQYPGKTFHGTVLAVGWGVERRGMANFSGMPVVEKENEWFLLPQRFPVQIRIDDPDPQYALHPGGSAFVAIEVSSWQFRQFFWQLFQI